MHGHTLLLNASYEALEVIDWTRAVTLYYRGKVEIVASHDRVIRSVSVTLQMPSIVRLLRFVKRRQVEGVRFCRANVYGRDAYTCQYCGQQGAVETLTYDHVVPQAQGGQKSWSNIVTACIRCNRKKDDRTPEQAGMALLRVPRRPHANAAVRVTLGLRQTPDSWRDYLFLSAELVETT